MLLLLGIAFVAGVITALSPCVLPVLPIVLAGGAASDGKRRPLAIVAGLVVSFTVFTLTASALLSALGLPQDFLRNVAIALLFVVAATLLVPRFGVWLERPLAFMTRRRGGDLGGGFLLGASLGLVFVPCAGPVLATISVLSAEHKFTLDAFLLTLAYSLGFGLVLLLVALGGQRAIRPLRARRETARRVLGIVVAGGALAILLNADTSLQTRLGSYSSSLQKHVERTGYARRHLAQLQGSRKAPTARPTASGLPDYGEAPAFTGIADWLNTPGDAPLTLASLRGKVVLVDFWTYSCINCLRTLPHLRAWYAAYRGAGLEIVGVHTPEFAFEHVLSNVRQATRDLHVTWPVALDNSYGTWNAYSNEYWPAEYLIDRAGHIRHLHFGEGDYGGTEGIIRRLLGTQAEGATAVADMTPREAATPETYLGGARLDTTRYVGRVVQPGVRATYALPVQVRQNAIAYGGVWTVGEQRAVAGPGARLLLHFHARDVYIVLGGRGTVAALVDGRPAATLRVRADRLYTVVSGKSVRDALLELRFTPGVTAYSFTFG